MVCAKLYFYVNACSLSNFNNPRPKIPLELNGLNFTGTFYKFKTAEVTSHHLNTKLLLQQGYRIVYRFAWLLEANPFHSMMGIKRLLINVVSKRK